MARYLQVGKRRGRRLIFALSRLLHCCQTKAKAEREEHLDLILHRNETSSIFLLLQVSGESEDQHVNTVYCTRISGTLSVDSVFGLSKFQVVHCTKVFRTMSAEIFF